MIATDKVSPRRFYLRPMLFPPAIVDFDIPQGSGTVCEIIPGRCRNIAFNRRVNQICIDDDQRDRLSDMIDLFWRLVVLIVRGGLIDAMRDGEIGGSWDFCLLQRRERNIVA